MLLLSSWLLLVAGVHATAFIPASAGISAFADFPLVPFSLLLALLQMVGSLVLLVSLI
jgi:hypothetical protein